MQPEAAGAKSEVNCYGLHPLYFFLYLVILYNKSFKSDAEKLFPRAEVIVECYSNMPETV